MLWPSLQRDFLLSLAAERAYSPKWSTAILDELVFHEAEKLVQRGRAVDEAEQSARQLIDRMRSGRYGPKLTPADLLTILDERYTLTEAVELMVAAPGLRDHLG